MNIIIAMFYFLPFVIMGLSFWAFAVLSNIVTGKAYVLNHRLDDVIRDVIYIDNQVHDSLFTFVNILPFVITGLYILIQLVDLKITKKEFFIDAMFTESISMILKGIMQIVTILPDANPNNPYCKFVPPINSPNLDSCGNMMWSGHVFHLIFALYWIRCIIMNHVSNSNNNKLWITIYDLLFFVLLCFEATMIVSLQIHYSVDVLVSIIYSFLFLTSTLRLRFIGWYRDQMNKYSDTWIFWNEKRSTGKKIVYTQTTNVDPSADAFPQQSKGKDPPPSPSERRPIEV